MWSKPATLDMARKSMVVIATLPAKAMLFRYSTKKFMNRFDCYCKPNQVYGRCI